MERGIRTIYEIGRMVRERRKKMGLTQDALAEKCRVSRLWISEVENGKNTVRPDLLFRLLHEIGFEMVVREKRPISPDSINLNEVLERYQGKPLA